jgi:hypothetical protein
MPIPVFTADGYLPPGIHECSLAEVAERFGQFQGTDKHPRLFRDFERLFRVAESTGYFRAIVIDGSFVTNIDAPNDIDLILVFKAGHDFDAETRPFEYNVVSRSQVRRLYGFDVAYSEVGSVALSKQITFFSMLRNNPDQRKGLLWLDIESNLRPG